jgi:hypothetical protein
MRSLRSLAVAHKLGQSLMGEGDQKFSLLDRLVKHAAATAKFNVFFGKGRDAYDVHPGRTVHEMVFNRNDGNARCPSSQQGYSPFTTWTRGLAWAMLGFAEQLEFLAAHKIDTPEFFLKTAKATCDFYIEQTPRCGVPYWDTGAPGLALMGDYLTKVADPFNDHEPVDSSAAAIAAQGLLRLGKHTGESKYTLAGLTVAQTILSEPYVSLDAAHQGLLLHTVYHRPNGWDHIPEGRKQPCGESCMWGDYHLRELALYVQRLAKGDPYLTFWG